MKTALKCSEIISMINSMVSLDARIAISFKLNDRKWGETVAILRKEKMALEDKIKGIDSAIRFLKGLEE